MLFLKAFTSKNNIRKSYKSKGCPAMTGCLRLRSTQMTHYCCMSIFLSQRRHKDDTIGDIQTQEPLSAYYKEDS